MQLHKLRATDIAELHSWLKRRIMFWSPVMRNEMLEIMAREILRGIIKDIRKCARFSAIMDKYRDCSNNKQLAICLRTFDMGTLQAVEYFAALYATSDTTEKRFTDVFLDNIRSLTLEIESIDRQCYGGASTMKGEFAGIQARLKELQPLYLSCSCLNVGIQDTIKKPSRCTKDSPVGP